MLLQVPDQSRNAIYIMYICAESGKTVVTTTAPLFTTIKGFLSSYSDFVTFNESLLNKDINFLKKNTNLTWP